MNRFRNFLIKSQFLVFVWKEFLHLLRDRKSLFILFAMPISQIVIFGFALTNEVKNAKIVIYDGSKDIATQQIIERIASAKEFVIVQNILDYQEIEQAFRKGEVSLALVFPEHFNHDLLHSHSAQIQIIADASNPNTASTLSIYIGNIIADYQDELLQLQQLPYQIDTEISMVYNPNLESTVNFVPGIIALILLLVCVMMTSVSIVREKEFGTMEVLLVSPFNSLLVIISKAIPYLVLSLVNLTVIILLSVFALGLPVNGSIVLLYAVSTLFIITCLTLGLLVSNLTSSQQEAMLISLLAMLVPSMLFVGFMFPIENMPYPLQLISHLIPAKWYYIIIKDIMVKGLGFAAIWKETLILVGMTLLLLMANFKTFKARLE